MEPISLTATAGALATAAAPAIASMDGQGLSTAAVAGVIMSHVIQPYMTNVKPVLKPLIPVVTGLGSSVIACMSQGMGFKEALHYGLVTIVASMINHRLAFAKPVVAA
jgi:hypothetical protein